MRLVCDEIDRWCQPLSVFDSSYVLHHRCPTDGFSSAAAAHAVRTRLQTLFYAHVPIPFGAGLRNVYRELLRDHAGEVASSPAALAIIERLHLLALVDRYEPILLQAVYEAIEERVNSQCKGEWGGEEGQLPALFAWVESTIHRFLIAIVRQSRLLHAADRTETTQGRATTEAQAILRTVFQRFTFYLHQTLGNLRTSELFDIVVDYPESKPALDDLKVCLAQTDRRSYVAAQMIAQNARRLLHPGADTKDIIAHYVATIRCLRILDPQGVLLARVAAPVRAYLRAREDTIRNIMAALIDEGGELATELERDPLGATAPGGQMEGAAHFGGPDDDYTDVNWLPDPIDAPPDYRRNRGSDVIQLLVSIYDSKEVFVKELQVLLGQRLLAVRGYDFEREVRNVEILKKRFGEASLAVCEVMLKDLADSKRIDSLIHSPGAAAVRLRRSNTLTSQPPVHPLIVSRLFWPTFQTPAQRLLLPPRLAKCVGAGSPRADTPAPARRTIRRSSDTSRTSSCTGFRCSARSTSSSSSRTARSRSTPRPSRPPSSSASPRPVRCRARQLHLTAQTPGTLTSCGPRSAAAAMATIRPSSATRCSGGRIRASCAMRVAVGGVCSSAPMRAGRSRTVRLIMLDRG